jgi:hypothetical protein
MSVSLQKINDIVVKPLKTSGKVDTRPVRGEKLFSECYSNILVLARKKSGKTCVVQKIIQESCGPNTSVIAFCSTLNKDANWKAIKKWCGDNNIPFEGFPSIKEGKVNILNKFLDNLGGEGDEEELSDEESEEDDAGQKYHKVKSMFHESDHDEPPSGSESDQDDLPLFGKGGQPPAAWEKKMFSNRHQTSLVAKDPYQSPEYLLVFDDLSTELKDPSFTSLVKKNRHYKVKTITSTQWVHDVRPDALKQMDYILLFKGFTDDKLEKIIRDGALGVDFARLNQLYNHAVKEPFNFLYIDTRHDGFRKNFNQMYKINNIDKKNIPQAIEK